MIGSYGNYLVFLRKSENWESKIEGIGNLFYRGDGMRRIKMFLLEFGLGLRIFV